MTDTQQQGESATDLLPCPFCASNSLYEWHVEGTIVHPAYYIACDNCGARGPTTDKGTQAEQWNTRAALAASHAGPAPAADQPVDAGSAVQAELKVLREQLCDAVIKCGHMIEQDVVTLYRDSRIEGNAFSQLLDRLVSATHPAEPVGGALVAKGEQQDQALVDLMPKRAAFLAWAKKRALDVTEDKDTWGKRKFAHSHVQALWDGWFNAPAAYASESAAAPADQTQAARDVLAERRRQVEQEGWAPEHDDSHKGGEMAQAAACYAIKSAGMSAPAKFWPWSVHWFKGSDPRRCLVKAGALILADIERLDRATPQPTTQGEGK